MRFIALALILFLTACSVSSGIVVDPLPEKVEQKAPFAVKVKSEAFDGRELLLSLDITCHAVWDSAHVGVVLITLEDGVEVSRRKVTLSELLADETTEGLLAIGDYEAFISAEAKSATDYKLELFWDAGDVDLGEEAITVGELKMRKRRQCDDSEECHHYVDVAALLKNTAESAVSEIVLSFGFVDKNGKARHIQDIDLKGVSIPAHAEKQVNVEVLVDNSPEIVDLTPEFKVISYK